MSDVQQDTTVESIVQVADVGKSRNEPATGGTDSQPSPAKEISSESPQVRQLQARQRKLDQHRESVLAGLQKIQAKIEKLPADQLNKRLELRGTLKVFEAQLEGVGEEQASLDREREILARSEEKARIDQYVKMRQQLGQDGTAVADKIRKALGVVEQLYGEWREVKDRDRVAKDILRSLAPDLMTLSPEFAWTTVLDSNFEVALDQVMAECRRSHAEIQRRAHTARTV
jgi:chromosome segregation ATPase